MIKFKEFEGCQLDIISEGDLAYMRHNRNLPEIRDWCRQVGLIDPIQQEDWHKRISSDPTIRMYTIYMGDSVGVCGLTDIDHVNQRAEFSCYIYPEHQGSGYATKALKTLFKHGFDDLNLNMIWGETFEGNAAIHIFTEKLGMFLEGTRRNFYYKKGKFLDAHLLSISKEEFRNVSLPTPIEFNPYAAHHSSEPSSGFIKEQKTDDKSGKTCACRRQAN